MTFKTPTRQPVTREDRMRAWIAKHVKSTVPAQQGVQQAKKPA